MKSPRLGLLVACRNEAPVVHRKLENLLTLAWPACASPPSVVVVDDHSRDGTFEAAASWSARFEEAGLDFLVTRSEARAGKNGALEHGLALLADSVDLVFLTDADVTLDTDALKRMAAAFEKNPRLGLACGEQVFLESLADAAARCSAAGAWDLGTAWVRRLESRFGKLFSVHGQLLAWRADLRLVPRPGVAADDVDLMLQARGSAAPQVRMVRAARFFEEKKTARSGGREQALRRARAWFQVFAGRPRPAGFGGFDAMQYWAYRYLPGLLPRIAILAFAMLLGLGFWFGGYLGVFSAAGLALVLALTPLGRGCLGCLTTIAMARRLERLNAINETWETKRLSES
jgi:glycosyltransferase involved in cell wall biosynthesis